MSQSFTRYSLLWRGFRGARSTIRYILIIMRENKDVYMFALRDEDGTLIGYYEKHEYRDVETAKLYNFT